MGRSRNSLAKLGRVYSTVAILAFTTVLLLLVGNLALLGLRKVRWALKSGEVHPVELQREVYSGLEEEDIVELGDETFERAWQYASYVGFKERPRAGRFVNVAPEGFRHSADCSRTLDTEGMHLYVFGGSTTFGYGVDDGSTIPSRLQLHLEKMHPGRKIEVFNFGRAYYDSNQETIALLELIKAGRVPAVAIFLDGLNEGKKIWYQEEMREMFDAYNYDHVKLPMAYVQKTSTMHVINRLRDRLLDLETLESDGGFSDPETILARYRRNKRIILSLTREFGIDAYFFIQPIPGYRNSFEDHPLTAFGGSWSPSNKQLMYSKLELLEQTTDDKRSFNLAAALEGYGEQAFVDNVHYSPAVCDLLAGEMARRIRLPEPPGGVDPPEGE